MERPSYSFTGITNIYLQGNTALAYINHKNNVFSYRVGDPKSRIFLNDHRSDVGTAALAAMKNEEENSFADIFSQSASVNINVEHNQVNITILERAGEKNTEFTLWLGSLDDNKMAIHKEIEWEWLEPIDRNRTVFASLVK